MCLFFVSFFSLSFFLLVFFLPGAHRLAGLLKHAFPSVVVQARPRYHAALQLLLHGMVPLAHYDSGLGRGRVGVFLPDSATVFVHADPR